jgi:hypothetical protein
MIIFTHIQVQRSENVEQLNVTGMEKKKREGGRERVVKGGRVSHLSVLFLKVSALNI